MEVLFISSWKTFKHGPCWSLLPIIMTFQLFSISRELNSKICQRSNMKGRGSWLRDSTFDCFTGISSIGFFPKTSASKYFQTTCSIMPFDSLRWLSSCLRTGQRMTTCIMFRRRLWVRRRASCFWSDCSRCGSRRISLGFSKRLGFTRKTTKISIKSMGRYNMTSSSSFVSSLSG